MFQPKIPGDLVLDPRPKETNDVGVVPETEEECTRDRDGDRSWAKTRDLTSLLVGGGGLREREMGSP